MTKVVAPHRKSAYPDLGEKELFDAVAKEIASGSLDDLKVEISLPEKTKSQQLPGGMEINIMDMMGGLLPKRNKVKKVTVAQAYRALMELECEKLIDPDALNAEAIRRAENEGIIFIDEMDKIAAKGNTSGPDVSREGVQRDILPIVEGCTVNTKYRRCVRPHPRTSRQVPDRRQAGQSDRKGLRPHPDRAGQRDPDAVHRAAQS